MTEVEMLRRQVSHLQECLRKKNLALDAMHWVWCDGGCESGTHRWAVEELTEEIVIAAERNTARLRRWFESAKFRVEWRRMTSDERAQWMIQHTPNAKSTSTDAEHSVD